jgi:competence protein ComEC
MPVLSLARRAWPGWHALRLAAWLDDFLSAERGRFSLWLPVFMGAGALAYLNARAEPPVWAGALVLACAALASWLARARLVARAVLLCVAAAAAGYASCQWASVRAPPPLVLPFKAVVLTGIVRGVDLLPADGRRVVLEAVHLTPDAPPLPRLLRIRLRADDDAVFHAGDTIRVRALVRPPAPPAYPGAWDLQRDAYFSGLGGGGTALGAAELIDEAAPSGLSRRVRALRDLVGARIMAALPGANGAIAATLLTGNTAAIPEPDRAAFRDSGLAHLLAVAGLHVGIVMGLFLGLTRFLLARSEHAALFWPCKQIAALTALASGGAYLVMTGAHVPIMRSFGMATLFTLAVLTGRRAVSMRGLGLAGVVLLTVAPWEVGGVSFQMSFSAVLALIAGYEAVRERLRQLRGDGSAWRRFGLHLAGLALTSVLAGTASAPFAAYHFGRVQSWFVVANMVAVPITASWVMPWGLASLALMPLGLERLALWPMGWGVAAILWIGRTVSALPAAVWQVPHMSGAGLCVLALGLAWLGIWRTRIRLAGIVAIVAGMASPLVDPPPDLLVSPDARLIALRTPHGAFMEAGPGAPKFVRDAWAQYWAVPELQRLPAEGEVADGAARCDAAGCLLRPLPDAAPALLLRRHAEPDPARCAAAAVLVAAEPARGRCAPYWPPLIDRFTVWRHGAYAVWLRPDGPRVLSDHDVRGDRPWVPVPVPRGESR